MVVKSPWTSHYYIKDHMMQNLSFKSHRTQHTHNFHIHIYIFSNRMFWRFPTFVEIRFLCLHDSLVTYLPFFLLFFLHITTIKRQGGVGYQTKYSQNNIPLSNIPSIVFPFLFSRYFFLLLICISKSKIITTPK